MTADNDEERRGVSDDRKHADGRTQQLRERALDLLAGASVHAERLNAAAEQLGLTPALLDGLGDQLYEAAVAQLDVASKILERSQAIVDRLFELGARQRQIDASRLERIDVEPDQPAQVRFVVRNRSSRAAKVEVEVAWDGAAPLTPRIGREQLPGDRETSVEIVVPASGLTRGRIYAGTAGVRLRYAEQHTLELPRHDFEIWVAGG